MRPWRVPGGVTLGGDWITPAGIASTADGAPDCVGPVVVCDWVDPGRTVAPGWVLTFPGAGGAEFDGVVVMTPPLPACPLCITIVPPGGTAIAPLWFELGSA